MVDSFRQWPLLSTRAGPPHRRTEGDTDRGMAVSIGSLPPHDAPLPLRAEHVVGVPVDHEWGGSEAVPCLPLPTLVVRHRANQGDPVLAPPGQERVGGDIARIDQLFPRRQLTGVQMRLNGGQHRNIGGRGRGGVVTAVIRLGVSSSEVAVTCTLSPVHAVSRVLPSQASGSEGELLSNGAGGRSAARRQRTGWLSGVA
jgi:hypothetical protein